MDGGILLLCPAADLVHVLVVGEVEGCENAVLFGAQVLQLLCQGVDALGQVSLFQQTPCRGLLFLVGQGALLGGLGLDFGGQGVGGPA